MAFFDADSYEKTKEYRHNIDKAKSTLEEFKGINDKLDRYIGYSVDTLTMFKSKEDRFILIFQKVLEKVGEYSPIGKLFTQINSMGFKLFFQALEASRDAWPLQQGLLDSANFMDNDINNISGLLTKFKYNPNVMGQGPISHCLINQHAGLDQLRGDDLDNYVDIVTKSVVKIVKLYDDGLSIICNFLRSIVELTKAIGEEAKETAGSDNVFSNLFPKLLQHNLDLVQANLSIKNDYTSLRRSLLAERNKWAFWCSISENTEDGYRKR